MGQGVEVRFVNFGAVFAQDANVEPIKTCPGACCEAFVLIKGGGYEELIEQETALYPDKRGKVLDGQTLIDMIEIIPDKPGWYTCNRYDPVAKVCTRYNERPAMCRDYPYGRECQYCTYDSRKPDVPGKLKEYVDG